MRDTLPLDGPKKNEAAIVNLDSVRGKGTHWVAFKKKGVKVIYYDSFGDLRPPLELIKYFYKGRNACKNIYYTYNRQQNFDTFVCGHLCLAFLCEQET